jgi:hypothetical protein
MLLSRKWCKARCSRSSIRKSVKLAVCTEMVHTMGTLQSQAEDTSTAKMPSKNGEENNDEEEDFEVDEMFDNLDLKTPEDNDEFDSDGDLYA